MPQKSFYQYSNFESPVRQLCTNNFTGLLRENSQPDLENKGRSPIKTDFVLLKS